MDKALPSGGRDCGFESRLGLSNLFSSVQAGLAQLVERWSHNPKVVSSILTPGTFAWMNSEGSGLGLQIHGGLTSQWFDSTFCAIPFSLFPAQQDFRSWLSRREFDPRKTAKKVEEQGIDPCASRMLSVRSTI